MHPFGDKGLAFITTNAKNCSENYFRDLGYVFKLPLNETTKVLNDV